MARNRRNRRSNQNCDYDSYEDSECGWSTATEDDQAKIIDRNRSGVVSDIYLSTRYGFIEVHKQKKRPRYDMEIFVHVSDISTGCLRRDEKVKFDIARENSKRPKAVNVRPASQDQNQAQGAPPSSVTEPDTTRRQGEVVMYNSFKRFGIVRCSDTRKTFLAHKSNFKPPLRDLRIGKTAQFKIITGPKGQPQAGAVEVIDHAVQDDKPRQRLTVGDGAIGTSSHNQPTVPQVATSTAEAEKADHNPSPTSAHHVKQEGLASVINDELTCGICLEPLTMDSVQTPCEHYFCRECIVRWLKDIPKCPACNSKVLRSQLEPLPRAMKNIIIHRKMASKRP